MLADLVLAVLTFIIGASVGSFLNLVADRLPAGRSIVTPRSFCESCDTPLAHKDLVPILSYIWIRGKCRYCSASIPMRFSGVEALTGALFAAIYFRYGLEGEFILVAAGVSLMLVVALIDLDHKIIPNKIILPSLVVLLILSPFWTEMGISRTFLGNDNLGGTVINSVLSGLGASMFFLVIALIYPSGLGMGDVKLGGVIGLLVGYPGALLALWLAIVVGGVVAVGLVLFTKFGRKDAIPFGPFLSMGAVVALLAEGNLLSWYSDVGDLLAGT